MGEVNWGASPYLLRIIMGSNIFFTNVYVEYGIGLPWKYDEFARLAISI